MEARDSDEHATRALAAQGRWGHAGVFVVASPKRAFATAGLVVSVHALLFVFIRSIPPDLPVSTERLPAVKAWLIFPSQHATPQEQGERIQAVAANRRTIGERALSRRSKSVAVHEEPATSPTQRPSSAAGTTPPTGGNAEPGATALPLDLSLRPGVAEGVRPSHPAVTDVDPTHRSTTDRIGSALVGDGATSIEELGDGRVRVRRGSACYEMARSRMSELDPFAQRPAWQTETCRR